MITDREFIRQQIVVVIVKHGRKKYTIARHNPTGIMLKQNGKLNEDEKERLIDQLIDKILEIYEVVTEDENWRLRLKTEVQ